MSGGSHDTVTAQRHASVMAELDRVGWRHGSVALPLIGTSLLVNGHMVGGVMSIEDRTVVEVFDFEEGDPVEAGRVQREQVPEVRTAHHAGLGRVVSATLVDLRDLEPHEAGPAVLKGLAAATVTYVRERWPST